jgi:DNA-3-methyladenine glycosylase
MSRLPSIEVRKSTLLPRSFYERSPEIVARDLIGKVLVHRYQGERLVGRVSEVEAYLGLTDPASHAFVGKTARNAVLFGPPGVAYVYFIYGMHYCLNVSCLPDGEPGGVLFRALLPMSGLTTMARLRGLTPEATPKQLTGGPGRLCEALGISREAQNGIDVTQLRSTLQLFDDGYRAAAVDVTSRIGIRKAADRPLRFLMRPGE